jgi:hypothetical protein
MSFKYASNWEDCEIKAILGYIVTACLKIATKNQQ